uniref:Reverse transcriptase zinc-binding domain-containing protein n=1 Tax=Lactuca sativa TaxID=4236 RepID=A0A9R1UZD5_LACSA|nr:hypothetical protein LSAT_V11C700375410 [Lactuca sativa]
MFDYEMNWFDYKKILRNKPIIILGNTWDPQPFPSLSLHCHRHRKMPSGEDGSIITFLKRELEASFVKIDSMEKENHELKQEMGRLKAQINTLKAHDLERKSMLWKKLQSSMDCGKVIDEPTQKTKLQVAVPEAPLKKPTSNHTEANAILPKPPPSPPQSLQKRVIAPPPPPPPLPSSPVGSRAVRRVPAVMEFYRSLMKRDTQKENKNGATGFLPVTSRDMIGEIENRSTYLTSIKSDVEKYGQLLNFLIREVQSAAFTEISDVEAFVKWLDGELSCLVDERAVLKHFPQWPERKADALREAACSYRDLKNLESEVLAFKSIPKQPLIQSLRKIQALEDRQSSISGLERTRESTSKRYKELQIPWQWLMDTGVVGQIKLSSLKLARECMRRIAKELKSNEASREGDLLIQGVRFAFRVHQFAGGFDTETMNAFEELKEIGSSIYNKSHDIGNSLRFSSVRKILDKHPSSVSGHLTINWYKVVPIKVLCFIWKAVQRIIPVAVELVSRGIMVNSLLCSSCIGQQENVDHVLVDCPFASRIRENIMSWCGSISAWGNCPKKRKRLSIICYRMLWCIWRFRNKRVFNNDGVSLIQATGCIKTMVFFIGVSTGVGNQFVIGMNG